MYFANPTKPSDEAMAAGVLGFIDTPLQGNRRPVDVPHWCADNGAFSDKFDPDVWWRWLSRQSPDRCWFAVAPDVLGDAAATLERSGPWLDRIAGLGFPVAYVAQDGLEDSSIPWPSVDVLFLGGSNDFKLGPIARQATAEALLRGKHVHMGRVNSLKRLRYARDIGCASVDGTFLTFGPKVNLPRLMKWLHALEKDKESVE